MRQVPDLLLAIPVRNPAARESATPTGLRLSAPLGLSALGRFLRAGSREKTFELDALGAEVWRACDGKTPVEDIIRSFARGHKVNVRQAQVSVVGFLNTLLARNLVALVAEKRGQNDRMANGK